MRRAKQAAAWVTVGACVIGVVGVAGVPGASAAYVCGQASACKVIDTSNEDASRAARNAEVLYAGKSLVVRRLDSKRRWEVRVWTGDRIVRVWTDFRGQVTDPHYGSCAASPEQRAVLRESSLSVGKAITKFAPSESVLRSAKVAGADGGGVIVLDYDDVHCAPLSTVTVDAPTGVEIGD